MKTNKRLLICGYCLLLSFAFLLICTKSSPLYPFNDWMDANAFFTMGKGMMNGRVLYRDLFEQKGAYLYFVHGLAYLISNKTFFGVYIFEVISFAVFLFYSHRLITLFLSEKYSAVLLPLISAVILNLPSFSHGDSAEEFCLPLLAFSLFYLVNYFRNVYPEPMSDRWVAASGIAAGIVFLVKFSLLGFWFGWMASVFFCMAANRHFLRAFRACFVFLAGMFAAAVPWIIYFGLNGAIKYWLYAYLVVNVTSYPNTGTLLEKLGYALQHFITNVSLDPVFCAVFAVGLLAFVLTGRYIKSLLCRVCLLFCAVFLILGIYGGGRDFVYYFLIISPFVILGFIALAEMFDRRFGSSLDFKKSAAAGAAALAVLLPLTLMYNHNVYFMKVKQQDLPQYKFAAIMSVFRNQTLLNYGSLDLGLYTVTGIVPDVRFFEAQNIDYSRFPLVQDEQDRYIKEMITYFVVVKQRASDNPYYMSIPYLNDNYVLLAQANEMYEGKEYRLLLFRKKIETPPI